MEELMEQFITEIPIDLSEKKRLSVNIILDKQSKIFNLL